MRRLWTGLVLVGCVKTGVVESPVDTPPEAPPEASSVESEVSLDIPEVKPEPGIAPEQVFMDVPMATATALNETTPFEALENGSWKAAPTAQWVKAHFYFGEEVALNKIEFDYCGEAPPERIQGFINFDERYVSFKRSEKGYSATFSSTNSRSLTMNFGEAKGVCIEDLRFFSEGRQVLVITPRRVKGEVEASSTLTPTDAYEAMNLFDSRMEYAWSTKAESEGVTLRFRFDEAQTIKGLAFWNGYQRSAMHCWKNARPKTIRFEDAAGNVEELVLSDTLGRQAHRFSDPEGLTGTEFTLTVVDAYAGKNYQDMVISELRFLNPDTGGFLIDSLSRAREKSAANKTEFSGAGLVSLLDSSMRGEIQESAGKVRGPSPEEQVDGGVTLRLRSDGSFYVTSNIFIADWNNETETTTQIFGLGNFEIKEVGEAHVDLRLFGLLRELTEEYPMGMDCNGCGRDCSQDVDESGAKASMFSDVLRLRVGEGGNYVLENKDAKPNLGFKKAEVFLEGSQ